MTIAFASGQPPLLGCAQVMAEALDAIADADPIYLTTSDKADLLRHLATLEARLAEVRLRVLAAAGDVAEATGARDAASWLAAETRQDVRAPRADQHLALRLDQQYAALREALGAGSVNLAQSRVIAQALDDLPDDVDIVTRKRAEHALITAAQTLRPQELKIAGRRILEIAAPEAAEAHEARLLAAEEAHAHAKTKLALKPLPDGTTRLSGILPNATAHRLATYLEAFTNPRKTDGTTTQAGTGSYPHRLGQAFCQLLETIDPQRLPIHGGDATTVIVTIGLDQLRHDLGTGTVIGGDRLTAHQARRLACTAKIIPAVLGARSEVLDLGRAQRLFTPAQRKALALRDHTCRAEGCTIPATWCQAHHRQPWSHGGTTDLADGILLCAHHHHRAHDPAWHTQRLPNGDVRYTRRT
ncbi:MAG TPA: DUF222 domain-containing protein [Nocardioides sp.]|uniref:HNH endonuclease signature motif containing protein n=1 Tax=Nocardioides sp. TaxID=35761 RepID=UPI002EDAA9DF